MPKMRGKFNVLKDGQYVEILVEQAEKDANGNVINDTYASIDDLLDGKIVVLKADKLNAPRKITLSGDIDGSVSFDGSGDITIETTDTLRKTSGLYHNSIYRGKDWGTFTSLSMVEQFLSDHGVSTGLFNDLYLGDYFKVQDGTYNVEWEIAGFDTYYQKGDPAFTNHHIALIPKTNLLTSKMNDTNDTTGGYYNSYMHQSVIPTIDTNLATILGNHLLARRALLSNAMNKDLTSGAGAGWMGSTTGCGWYTVKSCLMSEVAVYGSKVFSSSFHDIGEDCERLPIFQFKGHSYTRQWFWLRAVASASNFASANDYGDAYSDGAGVADGGVRPLICVG